MASLICGCNASYAYGRSGSWKGGWAVGVSAKEGDNDWKEAKVAADASKKARRERFDWSVTVVQLHEGLVVERVLNGVAAGFPRENDVGSGLEKHMKRAGAIAICRSL